jgi:hypothetical protein
MSSLLKVRPGIIPLFFSQKIAAKLPEKKIPSTEHCYTSCASIFFIFIFQRLSV